MDRLNRNADMVSTSVNASLRRATGPVAKAIAGRTRRLMLRRCAIACDDRAEQGQFTDEGGSEGGRGG
jgi:hypothetical protein